MCKLLLVIGFLLSVFGSAHAGLAPARPAEPPTIHLLLVGISQYLDHRLPSLEGPARDAELFLNAFLRLPPRANVASVILLQNNEATREPSLRAYDSFLRKENPDDLIVFWWSGHSDQLTDTNLILAPYDYTGQRLEGLSLRYDILERTPPEQKLLFIGDGCNIGDGSLGAISERHPHVAVLASSKSDEVAFDRSPFASAIVQVLKDENSDLDGDGLLSVEELFVQVYPKVVPLNVAYRSQHPTLAGLRSHRLALATAFRPQTLPPLGQAPPPVAEMVVDLPDAPVDETALAINGRKIERDSYDIDGTKLKFLGPVGDIVNAGISYLEIGRQTYVLWRVGQSLKAYVNPYKNSHAILVAIDDYDRKKDNKKRGPTGFPQLTGMVQKAEELKSALTKLGFPDKNIKILPDTDATAQKFEEELRRFWTGGPDAAADRLFVYFGGHGDIFFRDNQDKENVLVTYDFDKSKALLTSFQTRDLVERHSRNLQPKHVIFAIDVCYSGLTFLSEDEPREPQTLRETERLAVIERNMSGRARNIMVAGTGEERALWENGGIFSKALVDGLNGKGDTNNDGVIEFDELGQFVRDQVTKLARIRGFLQTPKYTPLNAFGEGRVMFIRPNVGG